MKNVEIEIAFLRDLRDLLIKYDATIVTFEGEFIVEFEQGDLWLDRVDKDSIDYILSKYPLTPDECFLSQEEFKDQKPSNDC